MSKFIRFTSKVNNKLRKHILGIDKTKNKKQNDLIADTHEMKYQFKVLIDRLLARE